MVTFREQSTTASAPTADEAKTEIGRILADSSDPYHAAHAGKQGHDERVAEVAKLFEAVYPEGGSPEPALNLENLPEAPTVPGWEWDHAARGEYHTAAAKLGMPESERVFWEERFARSLQQPQTDGELTRGRETAELVLRQMWGEAFQENLQAAHRAVRLFPEAVQDALDRGLGNEVALILRAAELGRNIPAKVYGTRRA